MVLPKYGRIFSEKAYHGGQTFLSKKFMVNLFQMGGLMIRSCQGRGGVS